KPTLSTLAPTLTFVTEVVFTVVPIFPEASSSPSTYRLYFVAAVGLYTTATWCQRPSLRGVVPLIPPPAISIRIALPQSKFNVNLAPLVGNEPQSTITLCPPAPGSEFFVVFIQASIVLAPLPVTPG